ncbi:MAG: hypothetical protein SGBAC_000064 [Bacillariaceae sp.]
MSHEALKKAGLDAFLSNDGPRSVVIDAHAPAVSTVSTVSQSTSPKSLSEELAETKKETTETTPIREFERKEENNVLRVNIHSAKQVYNFSVPVTKVLQRERDMREASKKARVPEAQWSCSRLYSLWKVERNKEDENKSFRKPSSHISVDLEPEKAMREYSKFVWEPWLTTCLKGFYETGSIEIPERCQGPDLLITLEYLRIITVSPSVFIFSSKEPYDRIRSWSAYFTKRRTILDWLIKDYTNNAVAIRTYTTSADSKEGSHVLLQVKDGEVDILGRNRHDSRLLFKVVYSLFCENNSEQMLTKEVPRRIRHDFRDQLLRFLPPKTKISFELHRVTVTKSGCSTKEVRPVLRIEGPFVDKPKPLLAEKPRHQSEKIKRVSTKRKNDSAKYQSAAAARLSPVTGKDTTRYQSEEKPRAISSSRREATRYEHDANSIVRGDAKKDSVGGSRSTIQNAMAKIQVLEEKRMDKPDIPLHPSGLSPMPVVQMEKQNSITSGLSQSLLDESTMGTFLKHPPSASANPQQRSSVDRSRLSVANRQQDSSHGDQRSTRAYVRKYEDYDDDTKTFTDSTLSTTTYENTRPKRLEDTPCDAFESFLFRVCDSGVTVVDHMLPAGACDRIGRDSDLDEMNGNTALVTYLPDENGMESPDRQNRSGLSSENDGVIAALSQDLTNMDNIMHAAKVVGDTISKQMDNLAYRVLDPKNAEVQLSEGGRAMETTVNNI